MMHTADSLYAELQKQLLVINKQIERIEIAARLAQPIHKKPNPDWAYEMRDSTGAFVMIPLIAARTNILSSMAQLKAADDIKRRRDQLGGW